MDMFFSILGTFFSLGGNILIMFKQKVGWIVWILGNLCWIMYNYYSKWNWPMVLMYIVYFIINVIGYIKWNKKQKD